MAKKKEPEVEIINLMEAIRDLAKERGISEDEIFSAIEDGIVAAFKREFGGANKQDINNVSAEIDRETGEIGVYKTVEVVEEVFDDANEISIEDAKSMDEDLEIGDMIDLTIEVENLGRLAAGAAKSSISQKLREAESKKIQKEFKDKMGDITSGVILRKDNSGVYVDIDRAEAISRGRTRSRTRDMTPARS